jgi:hypothetical protein
MHFILERIGFKKCYNLNDNWLVLSAHRLFDVDDECEDVFGRELDAKLITDFGFGRAFDLATQTTLFHVRLFYYSDNMEFNLNPNLPTDIPMYRKHGLKTGLKLLEIE